MLEFILFTFYMKSKAQIICKSQLRVNAAYWIQRKRQIEQLVRVINSSVFMSASGGSKGTTFCLPSSTFYPMKIYKVQSV